MVPWIRRGWAIGARAPPGITLSTIIPGAAAIPVAVSAIPPAGTWSIAAVIAAVAVVVAAAVAATFTTFPFAAFATATISKVRLLRRHSFGCFVAVLLRIETYRLEQISARRLQWPSSPRRPVTSARSSPCGFIEHPRLRLHTGYHPLDPPVGARPIARSRTNYAGQTQFGANKVSASWNAL